LFKEKVAIEHEFGSPLQWERLDHRRASRIKVQFLDGGLTSPEVWPIVQDKMVDAMVRLDHTLRPRVMSLSL
jgi:Domain of unknown function (DUF4268)